MKPFVERFVISLFMDAPQVTHDVIGLMKRRKLMTISGGSFSDKNSGKMSNPWVPNCFPWFPSDISTPIPLFLVLLQTRDHSSFSFCITMDHFRRQSHLDTGTGLDGPVSSLPRLFFILLKSEKGCTLDNPQRVTDLFVFGRSGTPSGYYVVSPQCLVPSFLPIIQALILLLSPCHLLVFFLVVINFQIVHEANKGPTILKSVRCLDRGREVSWV